MVDSALRKEGSAGWIRGWRPLFVVILGAFLVGNLVNAVRKGGDFDVYVETARRLLAGAPLYEGSAIAAGFVGPPAQALLFVPMARLSSVAPLLDRLAWYGLNLALLWYAVATWRRVLTSGPRDGSPSAGWADAALALAAIAFPLQTQFEHQNLNIVLLALGACAADALHRSRGAVGGLAIGTAVALKVYPILALPWLAARRSWRALAVATLAAVVFSLAPAVLRGLPGLLSDLQAWLAISSEGWPARRGNQSVVAMWGRYALGEGPDGYPIVTWDATVAVVATAVTAVVLLWPIALAALRHRTDLAAEEFACLSAMAAILSPIAWEHYWVAWFPVLLALRVRARRDGSRWARWSFWAGAVLISVSPAVGPQAIRVLRAMSVMTWGGLITCGSLALLLWRDSKIRAGRAD